jgi:hypothetical protein
LTGTGEAEYAMHEGMTTPDLTPEAEALRALLCERLAGMIQTAGAR